MTYFEGTSCYYEQEISLELVVEQEAAVSNHPVLGCGGKNTLESILEYRYPSWRWSTSKRLRSPRRRFLSVNSQARGLDCGKSKALVTRNVTVPLSEATTQHEHAINCRLESIAESVLSSRSI
jgi:hypothetical protein